MALTSALIGGLLGACDDPKQQEPSACTVGDTQPCYTGSEGTAGVGRCVKGVRTCLEDGSGFATTCEGEVVPAEEDCSSPFDDDCDGQTNEGCACEPGASTTCYSGPAGTVGVGICKAGSQTCASDGKTLGSCSGETLPLQEDCATPDDDDCDGLVNEPDAGCVCTPGEVASCYSGPEDTLDVGICVAGARTCDDDGKGWGSCNGEVLPEVEDCASAFDENCDGQVNEPAAGCLCEPGTTADCYSGPMNTLGVGICTGGVQTCLASGIGFGACLGEVLPDNETCNTTEDDDCDGLTNEEGTGCLCVPGSTASCYSGPPGTEGVGVCGAGLQTCEASGLAYGPCFGESTPTLEDCDTPFDENCDGTVNETSAGCACPGENPQTLVSENCNTDYGETLWRIDLPALAGVSIAGADGSVTLVMRHTTTTPPGYQPLPTPGPGAAILIGRYDSGGSLVWGNVGSAATPYPDTNQSSFELGVAPNGFTAVSIPAFGNGWHALGNYPVFTMPSNGFRALYSISPAGVPIFGVSAPRFTNLESGSTIHGVASTSDGGLYYGEAYYQYHLVRYDPTGAIAWQIDAPTVYSDTLALEGLADGGVLLAMRVGTPTIDLGGGPLAPLGVPQDFDLVVARYDVSGGLVWAVRPVEMDDATDIRVEGSVIAVAGTRAWAHLALADGALLSSETVPSYNGTGIRPHALMGASALLFADAYSGAQDFGLGPLLPYNGTSGVMFALREPGATRWARAPHVAWFNTLAAAPGYLYGAAHLQGGADTDGVPETFPSDWPVLYRFAY